MRDQIPIRVFHTDIFNRFRSADEGGPVVLVFSSTTGADRDPLEVCEETFGLLNALDQSAGIGDLCIGGRQWDSVSIWAKL
ncbi:hypothetical protein [Thermomonospora umbrina]|uniref:Uncharacterized protein n=1 Tax=Thermomonospora umbrina TaxID=111806 RepID=A0A3D9SX40_9ACTN|nr:hypothetical protein [Thermomonospora umbrina]REF00517.1 hypothetical protein DFJ69_6061 [Thermomonospora umbrina]